MAAIPVFHLAFPVQDLAATKAFYVQVLGCALGREASHWVDIDFFGHQLSAHLNADERSMATSEVDGIEVPLRHFGAVLQRSDWDALAARIRAAGVAFLIEPTLRYAGKPGEQGTFFILDPAGNGLEFKSFTRAVDLFAGTS